MVICRPIIFRSRNSECVAGWGLWPVMCNSAVMGFYARFICNVLEFLLVMGDGDKFRGEDGFAKIF